MEPLIHVPYLNEYHDNSFNELQSAAVRPSPTVNGQCQAAEKNVMIFK